MKPILMYSLYILISLTICSAQKPVSRFGGDCDTDKECQERNSDIYSKCVDRTCGCLGQFVPEDDGKCRPPTAHVLGSHCETHDICKNLFGSECVNKKCVCKFGWFAGSKQCNMASQDGDECTSHNECIYRHSDDNKECKDHQCVCKSGLHEGDDKKCKPNKALNEQCKVKDDCFQADSQNNNALECKEISEDNNTVKMCKCKQGYTEKGDKCNGSAARFILSISSLLLVAVAILKI